MCLSLTGILIEHENQQTCHHMKKKDCIIIKFEYRKQKRLVLFNKKALQNKSPELTHLKFSSDLFMN